MEVLQMQKETIDLSAEQDMAFDEELIDTLIAISVIAKRLAEKMSNMQKGDQTR